MPRFLVCHDYGMGGLWWWIDASSPTDILDTFAEVEVLTDPASIEMVADWNLKVFDLETAKSAVALEQLYHQREEQRKDPRFGRLLGKERVYLREVDRDDQDGCWYFELDGSGRRVRQVEVRAGGVSIASSADDWSMNPPFDLGDPELADGEIDAGDFEQVWSRAKHYPAASP